MFILIRIWSVSSTIFVEVATDWFIINIEEQSSSDNDFTKDDSLSGIQELQIVTKYSFQI